MKNLYSLLSVALCFFLSANLQAQTTKRCVTDEYSTIISQRFPQIEANRIAMEQEYYNRLTGPQEKSTSTGTKYVIPVVVHVIHRPQDANPGTVSNVSDERIAQQIAILNQDYRNFGGSNFSSDAVDTQIQFELAKKDPDGNCTDGINRIASMLSVDHLWQNVTEDSALKALIHWPNDRYLNLYVIHNTDASDAAFGYATFPWDIGTSRLDSIDGVVIVYDAFGLSNNGDVALGRTGTHEVGHWLGLLHTFQGSCTNNNCLTDNDKVCDTPPLLTSTPLSLACSATPNTCATDDDDITAQNPFRPAVNGGDGDQFDMIENYMDYSSDSCMNRFTAGQLVRMETYLNGARAPIWNSVNLTQTGLAGLLQDFDSVQVNAGLNGRVNVMCEYNGKLIIAGDFTSADGVPCNSIVAWNGASFENLNNVPQFFTGVRAMAVYKGKLFVGGTFTITNQFNFLASYDGNQWDSLCTNNDYRSTSHAVHALWVYKNKLYVGGDFSQVDGFQLNANRIATWDGSDWAALGTGLTGNSAGCYAMTVWEDKLVFGGRFTTANGVVCDKVVFWNGSAFSSPNTGSNVVSSGRLSCLYAYDGKLFTGGDYSSVGGNLLNGLNVYNGSAWSTASSPGGINRLALEQFNGYLWVGGELMELGEDEQNAFIYDATLDDHFTVTGEHSGFDSKVNCMTHFNNELYLGGDFTVLEGMNFNPGINFNYITKVHTVCIDPIPVGVNNAGNNSVFKLYPNPVSNMLTIENAINEIRVFNIVGEEIVSRNVLSDKTNIDVSSFAAGVYFVKSKNGVQKFVKE